MVIDNFNVVNAVIGPAEADSELIVNSNAMLTLTVPFQRFELISRRNLKVLQFFDHIKLNQLADGCTSDSSKAPALLSFKELLRVFVLEALYQNVYFILYCV